jgi:phosphotransacetylase
VCAWRTIRPLLRTLFHEPADSPNRVAGCAPCAPEPCVELHRPATEHGLTLIAAEFACTYFALMKGSLHTDELMSAVVHKSTGLRGSTRISHAFLFDLPRYPKLIALADCVVNIAPHLPAKRDILTNAIGLLQRLGIAAPKVGIVAAVETVNPAIPATVMRTRWWRRAVRGHGRAR